MGRRADHSAISAAKLVVAERDAGVASAADALAKAKTSRAIAWNSFIGAQRARARLRDIAIVMATFPDQATSISVAKVIYSTGYWLLSGDPILSEGQRRAGASAIVRDRLPSMPLTAIARLIVRPPKRMTNREAAVLLGVTWDRRQTLKLRQIGASDLSEDEYRIAIRNSRLRMKSDGQARSRRASGAPTEAERRAHQATVRLEWQEIALSLDITVRTAKARVKAGKIAGPATLQPRVDTISSKDTVHATLQSDDGERDGAPQGVLSCDLPHEDTDTRDRAECPPASPNVEANTMKTDPWDQAIAFARAQADTLTLDPAQRDRYVAEVASGWMEGYSKEVEDAEKAGAQAVRDALTSITKAPNFQSARDLALALFFETDDAPFVLAVLGGVGPTDQPIPADVSLALALRKEGVSPAAIGLALRPFAVMQ